MKITRYVVLLGLLNLACDDSVNESTITEYEGGSVVFSWKGIEPRNHDNVVFAIYNSDSRQEFWGYDSVFFSYYHPNVQFAVKVEITEPLKHHDYIIDVIGHNSGASYNSKTLLALPIPLASLRLHFTLPRMNPSTLSERLRAVNQ